MHNEREINYLFVSGLDEISQDVLLVVDVASQLCNVRGRDTGASDELCAVERGEKRDSREGKGQVGVLVPAHVGHGKVLCVPAGVPGSGNHVDRGVGRGLIASNVSCNSSGGQKERC